MTTTEEQPLATIQRAAEESAALAQPVQTGEGDDRRLRTPGFTRMRFDWRPEDRVVMTRAREIAHRRLVTEFADVYEVLWEVYRVVRNPLVDEKTGEIMVDDYGLQLWARNENGGYDEDFSKLTKAEKERFMFLLVTRAFEWDQRAADIRGEALMAKAQFEERFAIGFDAPPQGTVDDRRAAGNLDAREERYFAIYMTWFSRKADALLDSAHRLESRLRDALLNYPDYRPAR